MKQAAKLFFSLLFILISNLSFAQDNRINLQVDSLINLAGDPFECNSVTWRIIANKKEAIQILIDKLDDTTMTQAIDKCKLTHLRVGDLAYLTLKRIMPLPFFAVTGIQCDLFRDGCQVGVFEYMETSRFKFKGQVQAYYDGKKDHLVWRQLDSNHLTPCYFMNNIRGQYY
ncbi:MAG: hypothetical protein CFE21_03555 [Bacteroidetes bacterium B1(2017)]|nr:MAG: hypothetical protein CFE21_03555 [Bacteroidetes bacterium B1(2017)]